MVKLSEQKIVVMKVPVQVTQSDIEDGECGRTDRCMHKLACTRALIRHLGLHDEKDADVIRKLRVKVDGQFIKFNYGRYRWRATTPNTAKNSMLDFDNPKRHHLVKPHRYTVNAVRGTKITPFTRERQDQVNEARRVRIAEGRRDKDYGRRTTHQRVIGMAAGYG